MHGACINIHISENMHNPGHNLCTPLFNKKKREVLIVKMVPFRVHIVNKKLIKNNNFVALFHLFGLNLYFSLQVWNLAWRMSQDCCHPNIFFTSGLLFLVVLFNCGSQCLFAFYYYLYYSQDYYFNFHCYSFFIFRMETMFHFSVGRRVYSNHCTTYLF